MLASTAPNAVFLDFASLSVEFKVHDCVFAHKDYCYYLAILIDESSLYCLLHQKLRTIVNPKPFLIFQAQILWASRMDVKDM